MEAGTVQHIGATHEYTYPAEKITSGKTYNVRVYVTNGAGLKGYSDGANQDGIGGDTNKLPIVQTECAEGQDKWDNGKITKAATCTETGTKELTCSVCGKKKTEEISALGHEYSIEVTTVNPTCTDDGYTTYRCSRCTSTTEGNYVDALGHNWEEFSEYCDAPQHEVQSHGGEVCWECRGEARYILLECSKVCSVILSMLAYKF